jgi:hypothetical protein
VAYKKSAGIVMRRLPSPSQANVYREEAKGLRERASKAGIPEARDELNHLAEFYERLAAFADPQLPANRSTRQK